MNVEVVDGARTRDLRRRVLRPNLAPDAALPGDDAPGSVHLAALLDDTVVSTCVVLPATCPLRPDVTDAWQLRAMATDPAWHGRGAGRTLVEFAAETLVRRGAALLWCDARVTAIGFYERLGFHAEGGVFPTAATGLPHRRMWRELSAPLTPSVGAGGPVA